MVDGMLLRRLEMSCCMWSRDSRVSVSGDIGQVRVVSTHHQHSLRFITYHIKHYDSISLIDHSLATTRLALRFTCLTSHAQLFSQKPQLLFFVRLLLQQCIIV